MATYFELTHNELGHVRYLGSRIEMMAGDYLAKKKLKLKDVNELLYQAQNMVKTITVLKAKITNDQQP